RPAHLRGAVSHRDGRHGRELEAYHGQLFETGAGMESRRQCGFLPRQGNRENADQSPMKHPQHFLLEHQELTRRHFLRLVGAGAAAAEFWPLAGAAEPPAPELAKALESLEPLFTSQEKFRDVSRGKPLPHSLSDEKKRKVGLTRETWKLEV